MVVLNQDVVAEMSSMTLTREVQVLFMPLWRVARIATLLKSQQSGKAQREQHFSVVSLHHTHSGHSNNAAKTRRRFNFAAGEQCYIVYTVPTSRVPRSKLYSMASAQVTSVPGTVLVHKAWLGRYIDAR